MKFLYKDVICQQGVFKQLFVDGSRENADVTTVFVELYNIKRVVVSTYHPQAQSFIKRNHKPIIDTLVKIDGLQPNNFHTILQADRMTVKQFTRMTLVRVIYGYKYVLLIKLYIPTWQILPWETVWTTIKLLVLYTKQFN